MLQSCGDDRLWLRFRKYTTIFTLCVHWTLTLTLSMGQIYQVYSEGCLTFLNLQ